jgi:hypothetical protein
VLEAADIRGVYRRIGLQVGSAALSPGRVRAEGSEQSGKIVEPKHQRESRCQRVVGSHTIKSFTPTVLDVMLCLAVRPAPLFIVVLAAKDTHANDVTAQQSFCRMKIVDNKHSA